MSHSNPMGRRAFVAAAATAAALPAATTSAAPAPRNLPSGGPGFRWSSGTAEQLSAHLGRRFRFLDAEGRRVVLQLVEVEAAPSGPARPDSLSRREGLIAAFDGPDKAPLVAAGPRLYRVRAVSLGEAVVMAAPVRRRDGTHLIEIVLN